MSKNSYVQDVVDMLIEKMEEGTAPWQKPWKPGGYLPFNPTTDNQYRGINTLMLQCQMRSDPRWMTFKQAQSKGYQVKKGERATRIQYWKTHEQRVVRDENKKPVLDENGKQKTTSYRLERAKVFYASVFNAEQIKGIPELEKRVIDWNPIERAEKILMNSGAVIKETPDRAFYSNSSDYIGLPPKETFGKAGDYYGVALHELGHWTGAKQRLNRDLSHPFGSQEYAKEELRAEIASMTLGTELQVGRDVDQNAAYVESWISVLKDDPLELFRAASDAEKICSLVRTYDREKENEEEIKTQGAARVKRTTSPTPVFSNPTEEFKRFLEENGASPVNEINPDEKTRIHADGDKKGSLNIQYTYYSNANTGVPAGYLTNFKTGEYVKWTSKERTEVKLTSSQIKKVNSQNSDKKKGIFLSKINNLTEELKTLTPAKNSHPWATRKKVDVESIGLKVDARNNLVVPLVDKDGNLKMVQRIWGNGNKQLEKDCEMKGSFFCINPSSIEKEDVILVAEGLSTALTLNQLTGKRVYASMTSNNLKDVALIASEKHKNSHIFIAGDNDKRLENQDLVNVGMIKATEAAKEVCGTAVFPPLTEKELKENTDWNDYRSLNGENKARSILKSIISKSLIKNAVTTKKKNIRLEPIALER